MENADLYKIRIEQNNDHAQIKHKIRFLSSFNRGVFIGVFIGVFRTPLNI